MSYFIQLDLKSRILPDFLSNDFSTSNFPVELMDGSRRMLQVQISETEHEILKNVYNLAFGPLNKAGRIDHYAELEYTAYSNVFSTILYTGYRYLHQYPDRLIGIDGSTNSRAYLYYRFILKNIEYLNQYFDVYGVKYLVRIARIGKKQYDNPFDFEEVHYQTVRVRNGDPTNLEFMYNYFVFKLKN